MRSLERWRGFDSERLLGFRVLIYRKTCVAALLSVLGVYLLIQTAGPHQYVVQRICRKVLWCLYWIGLGECTFEKVS